MNLISTLLIILPFFVFAQKNGSNFTQTNSIDQQYCRATFQNTPIGSSDRTRIKSFLLQNIENLKANNVTIEFTHIIESPAGIHFTLEQYYNNTKLYRSQIKVNMDKNGNIKSVFDNSYSVNLLLSSDFPSEEIINKFLPENETDFFKEHVYFYNQEGFIPAVRLEIATSVENYWEYIIDSDGNVIYQRDMNMYHGSVLAQDTMVTAKVFSPDPLTSSGAIYGTPYVDNSDSDVPELNAQRVTANMVVDYDNGTFRLESPYAKITEHSDPITVPATSNFPDFSFTRSQQDFEDVNAFYHVTTYQNYLQSLGFFNLVNYQINIDAHALNGSDNSSFTSFFSPPRLNFGEGGVDDAEDADVIVHEYGHAIMFSAAPNTNVGTQRQALDEAMGDYFASSYSKAINPFSSEKVFTWDGHNTFWPGRFSNSVKHYPEDLNGSIHSNGEIWASTMMQINNDIGREITDQILLQSAYSYVSNMTMTQAAQLFLQADTMLNAGVNAAVACLYFGQRGLLQCGPIGVNEQLEKKKSLVSIINTIAFANGNGNAELIFGKPSSGTVKIYDLGGNLIFTNTFLDVGSFPVSFSNIKKGLYFLKVETSEESVNFKLVRF